MTRRALAALLLAACFGLPACTALGPGEADYLAGYPALAGQGLAHVVVEIPAGTHDKWEVDKATGSLRWEREDGRPRVIRYLAYPANYGMVPRTSLPSDLGGDDDPLDVLLLGPRLERGTVTRARPIGLLRLLDDGERDDKVLAVQTSGPFSDVVDLEGLESRYPGTRLILETWFTNYKGPGRVTSVGFGDAAAAMAVVQEASRYYEANARSEP